MELLLLEIWGRRYPCVERWKIPYGSQYLPLNLPNVIADNRDPFDSTCLKHAKTSAKHKVTSHFGKFTQKTHRNPSLNKGYTTLSLTKYCHPRTPDEKCLLKVHSPIKPLMGTSTQSLFRIQNPIYMKLQPSPPTTRYKSCSHTHHTQTQTYVIRSFLLKPWPP